MRDVLDAVTYTKQLEDQLRQLQKVDVLGHLTAGIAHDFNNILTAIMGYADLIEKSVESSEQLHADIGEIRRATERAAGLTRQILAFTRNETPNAGLLDLNSVVIAVTRMLTRLVGADIDLTVNCQDTRWRARADVTQIEQVLVNLVVNARDALPAGGRIAISTRELSAETAFAAAHPGVLPGRYLTLEVADDGLGMSEDVRARLFEPFFTTKTAGRGTGLGLSVVSTIVRQSHGHILVESAPGRGTCFTILLPVTGEAAPQTYIPSLERRQLNGQAAVLLVEDEAQVRTLVAAALRRHGYTVHEAADGEEALALVARGGVRPDLLITDLAMPHMGGIELARSLQSIFSSMKVLYVSGYTNWPDLADRQFDRGVACLQKPFAPADLLGRVRGLLTWHTADRRVVGNDHKLPAPQVERSAKDPFRAPLPPFRTV